MSQNLVIVESPAKAKTIEKYLGKDFHVLASYGHIRDLVPKEGAVDPEHDFAMKYEVIEKNQRHVQAIAAAAKKADALYLATDPDREGEAISWHLYEILKEKKLLKDKPVHRVVFHEITKRAITEAIANPAELSIDLINAQQARRALDYLVGFKLSPLLWKKIRRGLSAGRVQSPALRMIVEREAEIAAFQTREYWTIESVSSTDGHSFKARLTYYQDEKIEQFSIVNEEQAYGIRDRLLELAQGHLVVEKVEEKERKRNPAAPFTTSTLQQEAARKLGFTTRRTMSVAQQLYEGIDLGGESVGLISYMRTDSVNLANEAVQEIRDLIAQRFGKANVPGTPRTYKTKSKNAQEAHEAIRPTSAMRAPEQVKPHLSPDQFKLYQLIWKRTVACQMIHATIGTTAVDLQCGERNILRATGSTVINPGFMAVYLEGRDDAPAGDEDESFLPALKQGQRVELLDLIAGQHFTEPPPRYTEASLVKTLEEFGIGRPSTYASIISTLQQRRYVELDNKRFVPTDVGTIVNKFLTEHFTQYVDYHFTANLEDELDAVSRGEKNWIPLLKDFWGPFQSLITEKDGSLKRADVTHEAIEEACPQCGGPLSIRLGRNGRFIGCNSYPTCKYTRNLNDDSAPAEPEVVEGRTCPLCDAQLVVKTGRYGKFIGCSGYPTCKHIEPLEKPQDTGIICPVCGKGNLTQRKSRFGKLFYSCSTYPGCTYAVWNPPLGEPCPNCRWPILTLKTTKRRGTEKVCPQKECGYATPYEGDINSAEPA
ncbi:type I DNA topoisomerase [Candidatus Methylospira mobilis]|uniref:DNA topoisomerase 1 n=1 Tax=Candidatus Methylospira mobilis TaxID=1808979 RepID=A0A5Q0BQ64_9GAMM|nr:type I DNA topoisomerase [Candidatus Methylospira mobilis]QFY44344.1 type I DNA topoisomerase [Candidatus Methylospira mobilis]WNV06224.1 type I DNA topoisomerase [Candidatus Methylospira mobilis]